VGDHILVVDNSEKSGDILLNGWGKVVGSNSGATIVVEDDVARVNISAQNDIKGSMSGKSSTQTVSSNHNSVARVLVNVVFEVAQEVTSKIILIGAIEEAHDVGVAVDWVKVILNCLLSESFLEKLGIGVGSSEGGNKVLVVVVDEHWVWDAVVNDTINGAVLVEIDGLAVENTAFVAGSLLQDRVAAVWERGIGPKKFASTLIIWLIAEGDHHGQKEDAELRIGHVEN